MNLAPETTTIEAQRSTELLLLDHLRSTNPHLYALWCDHPDHNKSGDDSESTTGSATENDASPSPASMKEQRQAAAAATAGTTPFHYAEAQLHRAAHVAYASTHIQNLPNTLQGMYPSRPWVAYWCLQAVDLLGAVETDLLPRTPAADIAAFLYSCLSRDTTCEAELNAAAVLAEDSTQKSTPTGEGDERKIGYSAATVADGAERPAIGFAGGPVHQLPHLAASYAACCALAVLSVYDKGAAIRRLPRAAIKRWLLTLRNEDGSFRVHGGGESDIRASYCVAVITSLLCLDDPSTFDLARCRRAVEDDDIENADDADAGAAFRAPREYVEDVQYEPVLTLQTARFVAACQTHEGGFTCASTASEAHGAYTQCGLAALLLMKQPNLLHQSSLRRWLAARQLNCEGGFSGRTNKLVDSCYSHWIGASHVLLRAVEAYTKCFPARTEEERNTRGSAAEDGEEAEKAAVDASSAYLLAKEVVLLDHAQLLDAKLIQTTETAAWDRAEADHSRRVDLVDQFLGADDDCLRAASAKRSAWSALYDDILKAHDPASASPAAQSEAAKDIPDERVRTFHRRQAFLYADVGDYYFNQRKLQDYVLRCCQDAGVGGLMDKPGTAHDTYHTCYSLSGMSAAQNLQYLTHATASVAKDEAASPLSSPSYLARAFAQSYLPMRRVTGSYGVVLDIPGPSPAAEASVLRTTSPIFNIHQSAVLSAWRVWGLKSCL
ncbi:farnesyltransferase beta subunit [Leptomonas pyrrhocoris]|uniref:Farnesyltransferase beta subunit n=1 Tax=Leptomonas pyrrhocoris TaxID=157538 RepID=A0A0M9GBC6_LEPPY|nr:farnesyltransferase beta subunit [Leptomonas pyrrhocoris]KPA86920.1 farnesyltransferase beta subunit [Leptomonas pyrrhocoris]|eukprot:XP_015665359.1 farnesyltransferase beta subunit [Leptomonas pyrrhocoris]